MILESWLLTESIVLADTMVLQGWYVTETQPLVMPCPVMDSHVNGEEKSSFEISSLRISIYGSQISFLEDLSWNTERAEP